MLSHRLLTVFLLIGFCGLFAGEAIVQEKTQPQQKADEIIVKFRPGTSPSTIDSLATRWGLEKLRSYPKLNLFLFKVRDEKKFGQILAEVKKDTCVVYAEPNYMYRIEKGKTDTTGGGGASSSPRDPGGNPQAVEYKPGEILVKFKREISPATINGHLSNWNLAVKKHLPQLNIRVCRIPEGMTVEQAVQSFQANPDVEYAEPNYVYHMDEVFPNDPKFGSLWGLHNVGQGGGRTDADIDAPEAWEIQRGSETVIIGIVDTGVEYDHEDLQANMWINPGESGEGRETNGIDDDGNGYIDDFRGWDFVQKDNDPKDGNGHGTHVAGTIGAIGNNARGVTGINWRVRLMPLRFLNVQGSGYLSDAIEAILYGADMGAKILNNSWGGYQFSQALQDAIRYALQKGVLFVAAAGNEKEDNDFRPHYPSSYDLENIIAVAASDNRDRFANFTNWGKTSVDLAAPGVNILSCYLRGRYEWLSGTSMAAPHVAGVAGLVWAQFPNLNYRQVKARILGAVDFISSFEKYLFTGGRLNAARALSPAPIIAYTTKLPDTPNTQGPYQVTTTIIDDQGVSAAYLLYSTSGSHASSDSIRMRPLGEDKYGGDIPGQPLGTTVTYYVSARDYEGHETRSRIFQFRVREPGGGGVCCGAFAITTTFSHPVVRVATELLANAALVFGPIAIGMLLLRRRRS